MWECVRHMRSGHGRHETPGNQLHADHITRECIIRALHRACKPPCLRVQFAMCAVPVRMVVMGLPNGKKKSPKKNGVPQLDLLVYSPLYATPELLAEIKVCYMLGLNDL